MATTRVSISLTPHELSLVQQAMRVFSTAISNDLHGKTEEIPFDGTLFNNNWNLIYATVEEIRSSLGDGEPRMPNVRPPIDRQPPARIAPPPASRRPARRRKANPMTEVRKAKRTVNRVAGWLK